VRAHADPHLTCILVGNKRDLAAERRRVSEAEGRGWAAEEGLLFVEASAKSGANVEEAFEEATRDILAKIRRGVFDDDRVRTPFFCFLFGYGADDVGHIRRESSCRNREARGPSF